MISLTTATMPTFKMPKAIKSLLLWLVLLAVPLPGEAKTYLLSVGISDYPGSWNDLLLPHNKTIKYK